ncbi:hypothetical protein [Prescottella equi]|uniref:hypothetical protein n=1 Tax=Rhodococcus hoagii TaxID=43767 RepID=UPI00111BEB08|nr:hypothetical protein [Prescottella equi]
MTMASRHGRRNPKRPPKAKAPILEAPLPDDIDTVMALLEQENSVLVCANAGIEPIEESERRALLGGLNMRTTLLALAELQSRLDIATTTNWTQRQVEAQFLSSLRTEWAAALIPMVRKGDFLLPPRTVAQVMREVLENSTVEPTAPSATAETILHLMLSINTEHLRNEYTDDGLVTPDVIHRIRDAVIGLDVDETMAMLRELMLDEVSALLYNAPLKLEVLQSNMQDTWFAPWPDRANDPRLGRTPADAFAEANGIDLLDMLAVGQIISDQAAAGQVEFHRDELIRSGATDTAVTFLVQNMSLSPAKYRRRLHRDRARGSVHNQRYTLTERPFVSFSDDSVLLLRYQWGIDRFFGSHLYWQTLFGFGKPEPRSAAESFSLGMNYVFERVVGDTLTRIVASSPSMSRTIPESELQDIWREKQGEVPSVCNWVIPAGQHCFVIDATNHHLNHELAQGLGSVDDYSDDMDRTFVDGKFRQLSETITRLRSRDSSRLGLRRNTTYVPLVVVPENGVPNLDTTDLDLQLRSLPAFKRFDGHIYAPAVLTLSDLQLLEGIAEHYKMFRIDVADIVVRWRAACMNVQPIRLQDFLEMNGFQRPLPRRMLRAHREMTHMLTSPSSAVASGTAVTR